jgi:hypothetical protein
MLDIADCLGFFKKNHWIQFFNSVCKTQNIGCVEIRVMVFVIIYIVGFQIYKDLTQRIVTFCFMWKILSRLKVVSGSKCTEASLERIIYSNPQMQLDMRCKAKFYWTDCVEHCGT